MKIQALAKIGTSCVPELLKKANNSGINRAFYDFFLGINKSVIVPSAISAAKLKVSDRVGCA